jgi:hypothetical protein
MLIRLYVDEDAMAGYRRRADTAFVRPDSDRII